MKKPIYVIRDRKIGFQPPMVMENDETAKRAFKQAIKNKETNLGMFYEDMELFQTGMYDDTQGTIEGMKVAVMIMTGIEAKNEI